MKLGTLTEPVLVGRKQEIDTLRHILILATKGQGNTVFISGEAGAGKTRLVRDFLIEAKNQNLIVLIGWCLAESGVPYFPFIEAFKNCSSPTLENCELPLTEPTVSLGFQVNESRVIENWFTGGAHPSRGVLPHISPTLWRDQMYTATNKVLYELTLQMPVILLLEDIHWADSASLALLHYIARTIRSERILIIATYRTEAASSDEQGRDNRLSGEKCVL